MEFELVPQAPFDFDLSLRYYSRSRFDVIDSICSGEYRRIISVGDTRIPISVRSIGTIEFPKLGVQVYSDDLGDFEQKVIDGQTRLIFRSDDSLKGFYEFARADPVLDRLVKNFWGLKNIQTVDIFENLVWGIAGQQVGLEFAYRLKKRLAERFGERFEFNGTPLYSFPSPAKLAAADINEYQGLGYSGNKAEYIKMLAADLMASKLNLTGLRTMPDDGVRSELLNIRGIGYWTCEYCLICSLGREDACPSGDSGLKRALAKYYGLSASIHERQIEKFMDRFKPYRGMATIYLWHGLADE